MARQENIQIQYPTKWDTLLFENFPVMRLQHIWENQGFLFTEVGDNNTIEPDNEKNQRKNLKEKKQRKK